MNDPFFARSTYQQGGVPNGYKSPLEQILADLRRKYVAQVGGLGSQGAGSTDAFLMEYSLLPSTGDVDIEDRMKNIGDEDRVGGLSRNVERRKTSMSLVRSQSNVCWRRSSVKINSSYNIYGSNSERHGGYVGASSPRTSIIKHSAATSSAESLSSGSVPSSFLDQRAAFMECATRYRSGLASTSHAENLIACAPHLRHISPASADMQRRGQASRNPITAFLFQQTRAGESTGENPSGGGYATSIYATSISDYRTCLARKHVNHRVALELSTFVRVLANEMPLEEFAVVEGEIFSTILTFMHSNDNNKRLAGVAALDALIDVTSADEEKKGTKFAKNLSDSLFKASNVDYEFLSEVTNALGKMALGAANVDYVESVVKRVPEWLKRDRSDRR